MSSSSPQHAKTSSPSKCTFTARSNVAPSSGSRDSLIDREIELHDRAGVDFDRISDRTEGKPKQTLDINQHRTITPQDGAAELMEIARRLRDRLGPHRD